MTQCDGFNGGLGSKNPAIRKAAQNALGRSRRLTADVARRRMQAAA